MSNTNGTKSKAQKLKKPKWTTTTKQRAKDWVGYIRATVNGKRERVSPYFTASDEPEARFRAAEWARKNLQALASSSKETTEAYIQSFFKRSTWAETTRETHIDNTYNPHIKGADFLKLPLSHLTKQIIIDFIATVDGSDLTKFRVWNLLNMVFRAAMLDDKISLNPCQYYNHPKKKPVGGEDAVTAIATEDERKLVSYVRDKPFWKAVVYVALFDGLREAEVLGLQFGDFSKEGQLHIQRTCNTVKKVARIKAGTKANRKGSVVTNKIWVGRDTLEAINALQKARNAAKTDFIFLDEDGQLFTRPKFYSRWTAIAKKAGLPPTKFHQLRHTCGSNLIDQGYSLLDVAKRLSHKNAEMVVLRYGHPKDEKQRLMGSAQSERLAELGSIHKTGSISGSSDA